MVQYCVKGIRMPGTDWHREDPVCRLLRGFHLREIAEELEGSRNEEFLDTVACFIVELAFSEPLQEKS